MDKKYIKKIADILCISRNSENVYTVIAKNQMAETPE